MRRSASRTLIWVVRCRVTPDRFSEFVQLAEEFQKRGLPPSCVGRAAWSKLGDPHVCVLTESWVDLPSLLAHQETDAHRALLGGVRALGHVELERLLGEVAPGVGAPALEHLVVHDLRSPLAAVTSLVSVVEEQITGAAGLEQEVEDLRVARAECRRMSRMLSDLLLLSHIERRRLDPARSSASVRQLLGDVARAITPRAAAAGVDVVVEADETVALFDGELLRRLVDNLAENALRHVRRGDRIQLFARAEDRERLRIAVRNTGPALPAWLQERLFQPDGAMGDGGRGGSGLGLYLCRLVAEAHGGSISLVPRDEWNVSFEAVLPLVTQPGGEP